MKSTKSQISEKDSRVMECVCKHDYQDAKYGRGKRVHNPTKDKDGYRCTVCGRETEK